LRRDGNNQISVKRPVSSALETHLRPRSSRSARSSQWILAVAATLALPPAEGFAAGCDDAPFKAVIEARVQGRQIEARLTACRALPGDQRRGAVVLSVEGSQSTEVLKTYDVSLLLIDVGTGTVRASTTLDNVWASDAYKIDGVEVSDAVYPLRRGAVVFGVSEVWSGSSRVSFYDVKKLSLYAQRGSTLVPVLSDLVTDIYRGEGCDVRTTRTVDVQPVSGTGHARIRVSGRREGIVRDEAVCAPVVADETPAVLVVRDGKYVVPKRFGPFHSEQ
jgi:hypothetical protein